MSRWQRYWFADGGRTALAIVRIAVAVSVLLTLARLDDVVSADTLSGSHALYRPVGIWMMLGDQPPPGALVDVLWVLAWAGTTCMLLGIATRASTAVSFVAALALASLSFSASRTWSHQYNVVFLAQLAMLGSRSGDTLSLDALVRRLRGLPAIDLPRAYQWSLRLVQLAVALMFAGAVFHKFLHGHFTLRWALSDNLRHHLLMRFDLAGLERPPIVDWILEEPWRYRTTALLNMISQAVPLAAVFSMRRPWLRALAGSFFVIETIALGLVVTLWNLHWLPLAAVFVDWDRLIAWITKRPAVYPQAPLDWRAPRRIRVFLVAFITYDLLTSFVPALDQRLNTYPFSGFPMFATVRARPPYDQHQPYGVAGVWFEVTGNYPIDPRAQRWLNHQNRTIVAVRDPDELHRRMAAALAQLHKFYPDLGARELRLWLAIYEAPAHPAPARFERHRIAVMGELLADGTFRTHLGRLQGKPGTAGARIVLPRDVQPDAKLVYFRDDLPEPHELGAQITGGAIDLSQPIDGNPIYFVANESGTPWLVAVFEPWRWK